MIDLPASAATFNIEFHPENGSFPHVIVIRENDGCIWFAYPTLAEAEDKLPRIRSVWDCRGNA